MSQSFTKQDFQPIVAAMQFDKSDKISDDCDKVYAYQVIIK